MAPRVLLVEDHPVNVEVATLRLARLGCAVEVAGDGAGAVARAAAVPFDLVLMDVQLPGMDGLEAARRIRTLPAPLGRVPIVALTANALTGDRERCLAAGMDDYLAKPVRQADFAACLERWLGIGTSTPPGDAADRDGAVLPLLDPGVLGDMGGEASPVDFALLLGALRDDTARQLPLLHAAVAGHDAVRLVTLAHRLAGGAWAVGAARLAAAARALEQQAGAGWDAALADAVARLAGIAADTDRAIAAMVDRHR